MAVTAVFVGSSGLWGRIGSLDELPAALDA